MKKWAMIATWRMAVEGVTLGADILKMVENVRMQ